MTHNLPHSCYRELKNSASLGAITHLSASEGHAIRFGLYIRALCVKRVWERFHTSTAELLLQIRVVSEEQKSSWES